ncbi:hypothetical protein [Metaclostridioides mangenotii]|uniref:hypothetical protein n=1 Tax=Metaclostridioides mangenotii TaxID=1540 RepID=UPI0026ED7119|nr:hypothetical protein [Clostridioides mangenotii]
MKMTIGELIDNLQFIQDKFELENLYVFKTQDGLEFIDESDYKIGDLEIDQNE